MNAVQKKSLVDALSYCSLRELPQEDNNEFVWLRAIGLAAKSDGLSTYVLLEKNEDNEVKVIKDFGSVSTIRKITKVYPFLFLDSKYMPIFKTKTRDERLAWYQRNGVNIDELEGLSVKELDKMVIRHAVKIALLDCKKF